MSSTGKTLSSKELGETFLAQQIEKHDNPEKHKGLSFNHKELDEKTGGLQRGDLVVISGAQKAGKSTVALALAINFAKQMLAAKEPGIILHVSLEMRHNLIASKVLANIADIDVNKFRDLKLEANDWDKLAKGVSDLSKLPIYWNVACYTVEGIKEVINELKKINAIPRIVIIDYFQLMSAPGDKRHEQLRTISRELKELAMTSDSTVILLAQQTREALMNIRRQKQGNTLAGTQGLEQDLDLLLLILPIMENEVVVPHLREIWIALARNAEMQVGVKAFFSGNFVRFGMPAPEDILEAPKEAIEHDWTLWTDR